MAEDRDPMLTLLVIIINKTPKIKMISPIIQLIAKIDPIEVDTPLPALNL